MLKILGSALFIFMIGSSAALAQSTDYWDADKLQENKECLLKVVRKHMRSQGTSSPGLKIESQTDLIVFQDAMEKWWGLRPDFFLNVFDGNTNTIYLMNKRTSYKHPRTPVDSLVHELVHYIQVVEQDGALGDGDILEGDAVRIQTWFRETRGHLIQNDLYEGPCE
ncbi:MAG: hypothetical protein OM95_04590 [Bdellovibrio sp. ArHS]|uniref:hypothetical protein n=1 Tax=Bdellovibrio sp. ArHS TaxID=1569284 RepID=UPI00058249CC|nr:hypothetical protein [Bdellovibrio sp. ArHS]KHD89112.1 MAG: hypothetical protein OM95_04590 [Bdellovibrio sp. ArHS]